MKKPHDTLYGIRQQILLITLVPLVLMTLILAGYFVSTRISDNQAALIERGETVSRLLAEASEFGLISGLTHQLNALSQGPIQEADVADVLFYDGGKQLLFRSAEFAAEIELSRFPRHHRTGEFWLFSTPVISKGVVILDSPEQGQETDSSAPLGWIVVALSTQPMHSRENQIISNSLLLLLGGLLITFIIAARFAETLTRPLIALTGVVKQLEEGNLAARVEVDSKAEIGSLERGINMLGERVQQSNQILENQVEKATRRLRQTLRHLETQNNALQRARQHADQANLAKDEFLARMSHELRTPLTSVLGFTNMLKRTDLTFEQQEHCRIINQTSTMLLSLIDDILDFAKLQSDAIKLERIRFNPEEIIHEAIEMQSQQAAAKGLEIACICAPEACVDALGDPTRLRQIVTNLLSNAIKFTDQGDILIYLAVRQQNKQSIEFSLTVKDSGIGISKEQQQHLFNAFSQADSSITRRFGGTGLGLVIVEKLIQLMRGKISLVSEPGAGTQIDCSFFCKPVEASPDLYQSNQAAELVIFERHPENLKSLIQITEPMVKTLHSCATLQALSHALSAVQSHSSFLIFSLSANAHIASQQKLRIPGLFDSFQGQILLLTPSTGDHAAEIHQLRDHPRLSFSTKPVRRNLIYSWLADRSERSQPEPVQKQVLQLPTGLRVVIAEDNDFNRLLLRKILESAGATVYESRDGKQAIKQVREQRPDAVIMDVHMPVLDGISASTEIRKSNKSLPIIALTANVISSEEVALRQAGVSRIEYKPINDSRLISLLNLLCHPAQESRTDKLPAPAPRTAPTNLASYQMSKEDLHQELTAQLQALETGFIESNTAALRDHSHQLTGLAGLLELPELELNSIELNEAVKQGSKKLVWQLLWRLKRLIEKQQYLD